MGGERAFHQGVPAIEQSGMVAFRDSAHEGPGELAEDEGRTVWFDGNFVALGGTETSPELGEAGGVGAGDAERIRGFGVELHGDQAGGAADQMDRILRAELVQRLRQQGPHIFHGVVPVRLGEALGGPQGRIKFRGGFGVKFGGFLVPGEAEAVF